MAASEKLTNNTDEAAIGQLFDASLIYEVPYFQRPYRWKKPKLEKFQADLLNLVDDEENGDLHFMGAVIIQGRGGAPAAARPFQVIDGQQRLTTIFLHLLAAVSVLIENGHKERAKALFLAYLVTRLDAGSRSNLRLSPSGPDRKSLNETINSVLSMKDFKDDLDGFVFKPLLIGKAQHSSQINKNFKIARKFMREQYADGDLERLEMVVAAIVQRITVVQIDIKNALDGPKIFDSLNAAQERMTVGELVKNDIYSRGIELDDSELDLLENEVWQPFETGFPSGALFDEYFFPYGLFQNPNWKKSEVYSELQKDWTKRQLPPSEIIAELSEIQPDFLEIATGTAHCNHHPDFAKAIKQLHDIKCPSTIYPFILHVSHEVRTGNLDVAIGEALMTRLESFIARRAICGLEPSGLHAVFKGLWAELKDVPRSELPTEMEHLVRNRPTVQWPSDEEVVSKLMGRRLYGAKITNHLLRQFDVSRGGDHADVPVQIEHVLPQNPPEKSPWRVAFTDEERARLVDTIGNLAIVSGEMNREVSNQGYSVKRVHFQEDAMFKSTREIAANFDEWVPSSVGIRSEQIAHWAVARWPF